MKRLILLAHGGESWIGGLYYVRNMLNGLIRAGIDNELMVYIIVNEKNMDLFSVFSDHPNVELVIAAEDAFSGSNKVYQLLTGTCSNPFVEKLAKECSADWIFPLTGMPIKNVEEKCVFWIPDFQYMYYPKYFSKLALVWKKAFASHIAKKGLPLILSSETAAQDFKMFFKPVNTDKVSVVHFTSYLDCPKPSQSAIQETQSRYGIKEGYFLCSNQFWAHKNHRIVFQALDILHRKGRPAKVVFTGNPDGGDNGKLYKELNRLSHDLNIVQYINMLGFVERSDQLNLMAGSIAIIQPSLFEGWGTVLEDAKVIGKPVLLSDIPIHKEQDDGRAIFFDPENAEELANALGELAEDRRSHVLSTIPTNTASEYGYRFMRALDMARR